MKHSYTDIYHRANVDLIRINPRAWLVTRVEVGSEWRGQGAGGRLLDRVCMAADVEGVDLLISVEPDGTGLDHEALVGFYERRGFVLFAPGDTESAMIRRHKERRSSDPSAYPHRTPTDPKTGR